MTKHERLHPTALVFVSKCALRSFTYLCASLVLLSTTTRAVSCSGVNAVSSPPSQTALRARQDEILKMFSHNLESRSCWDKNSFIVVPSNRHRHHLWTYVRQGPCINNADSATHTQERRAQSVEDTRDTEKWTERGMKLNSSQHNVTTVHFHVWNNVLFLTWFRSCPKA